MKKVLICIVIIFSIQSKCYCVEVIDKVTDSIGINDFLNQSEKYLDESNLDIKEFFKDTLKTGKIDKDIILKNVKGTIKNTFKEKLKSIIEIIIIIIIHAILKSIVSEIGQTGTTKIVFYLEYLIISSIILKEFSIVVLDVKNTVNIFTSFMYSFIPILIALVVGTGNIITGSISQKLIIFLVSFIGGLIKNLIIPILLVSVAIGIVRKFFRKSSIR